MMNKILAKINSLNISWEDCLQINDTLLEAGDEIYRLIIALDEAQSYKADAERYRNLKEIICPMEGLSITFEYRKGDKKIANRKVFTLSEMEHDCAFSNRIEWNCAWLYGKIKRELEAIDQAMKESKI